MLASMTTSNGNNKGTDTLLSSSSSQTDSEEPVQRRTPLHSGLSALILAATSHLGVDDDEVFADVAGLEEANSTNRDNGYNRAFSTRAHSSLETAVTASLYGGHGGFDATTPSEEEAQVPEPHPTFPELLMTLASDPSNVDVITFLPDGKFFAVRVDEFASDIMGRYFPAVPTFDDFLDLLYDWGFSRVLKEHVKGTASARRWSSGSNHNSNHDAVSVGEKSNAVEVFRHPQFIMGDWERCTTIHQGETPSGVRLSALPDRVRIDCSPLMSDDSVNSKRRLSPGFLARHESESSVTSQRQRVSSSTTDCGASAPSTSSAAPAAEALSTPETSSGTIKMDVTKSASSGGADSDPAGAVTTTTMTLCGGSSHGVAGGATSTAGADEVRSVALSITTERLNLNCYRSQQQQQQHNDHNQQQQQQHYQHTNRRRQSSSSSTTNTMISSPLVDYAVESATQTIVTDAIETLLRDEIHTKNTYMKHEKELSRSTIPGVVPIAKQLFASSLSAHDTLLSPPSGAASGTTSTTTTSTTAAAADDANIGTGAGADTIHVTTATPSPSDLLLLSASCSPPPPQFLVRHPDNNTEEATAPTNDENKSQQHAEAFVPSSLIPVKAIVPVDQSREQANET